MHSSTARIVCDFVGETMPHAKLSLHWSVTGIHYYVTFE